MKRHQVAPGCFFEPDEDQAVNPVVGTNKKSALTNTPKPYYRQYVIELLNWMTFQMILFLG